MWRAWTSAVVAVAVVGGCDGTTRTEENVREALDQASVGGDVEVVVDPATNVVHLTGTVETLADRTRAGEVASAVVGTSGRVVNDLTVETLSVPLSDPDARLLERLDLLIDADPVLRERDVNFTVKDGSVVVTGEVRSAGEKDRVTRIVRSVGEVRSLTNELQVHPEP